MQRKEDWRNGTETTEREGLEIITEWKDRRTVGQGEMKNQPGVERLRGENRNGRNWSGVRAGRMGMGGNNVLGARDVDKTTGKLRDIGEMALLSGGPRQRGAEQGLWSVKMVNSKAFGRKWKWLTEE